MHETAAEFLEKIEIVLQQEKEKKAEKEVDVTERTQNITHTADHVSNAVEQELSEKYEAFKRAQGQETVRDIDSIFDRVLMEERYFSSKQVAIEHGLVTQESVQQLESNVQEKLGDNGVTITKQTRSHIVEQEK
ncbi:hypothetical protein [Bacillus sp. CDB3]|uniref:hypothetical protein n=1 Tax=Bacillus sp. CDB3 TaxID=360310 RepID=UPI0010085C55|nr:hypothetical protein [Bacillus sp. CDB3]